MSQAQTGQFVCFCFLLYSTKHAMAVDVISGVRSVVVFTCIIVNDTTHFISKLDCKTKLRK